jgi:hypothetical protein
MSTAAIFFAVSNYVSYKKVRPEDVPKDFDRKQVKIENTEVFYFSLFLKEFIFDRKGKSSLFLSKRQKVYTS